MIFLRTLHKVFLQVKRKLIIGFENSILNMNWVLIVQIRYAVLPLRFLLDLFPVQQVLLRRCNVLQENSAQPPFSGGHDGLCAQSFIDLLKGFLCRIRIIHNLVLFLTRLFLKNGIRNINRRNILRFFMINRWLSDDGRNRISGQALIWLRHHFNRPLLGFSLDTEVVLWFQIVKIKEISNRGHPLYGLLLLLLLELRVLMKNFCEMRDHLLVGVKII